MGKSLKVSIIVVTHNRHKLCNLMLEYLDKQIVKPYEVIVIDDASDPPFKALKSNHKYKLVILRIDQELGVSACRNLGVIYSKGDIIAFIDDDAIPDPKWIEAIEYHITKYNADIVGGLCLPIYLKETPSWWDSRILGCYLAIHNTFIVGCNFAVKRDTFNKVGLFRPHLGRVRGLKISNEETELILRAYKKGVKIIYCPTIRVYHFVNPSRLSLKYLIKRAWYQGISIYLTCGYRFIDIVINERKLHKLSLCEHLKECYSSRLKPLKIQALLLRIILLVITIIGMLYAMKSASKKYLS